MPRSAADFCQNSDTSTAPTLLERDPWFAGLPERAQAGLRALGRPRLLPAGGCLFLRGDAADGLYGVLAGSVLIGASNAVGKAALLSRLGAGQWFGELALFDHGPRSHDAWADEPCLLWHVPQRALLAWLDAEPAVWRDIGLLLAGKTRKLMNGLEQHTLLSSRARVAQRLLLLADGAPSLRLSQEALASAVGLSRQSCNAMLGQLAELGLIQLGRGVITVRDAAGLARESEG